MRVESLEKQASVGANDREYTHEEEIVRVLLQMVWEGRLVVIAITVAFAIFSLVSSINKPNIYRAEVLLAPSSDSGKSNGLASLAAQYGGLASLAGVPLGGEGGKIEQTLAILESRAFIVSFIEERNLYVPLFATKAGGLLSPGLKINAELYDDKLKRWKHNVDSGLSLKPSTWDAHKDFSRRLFVSQDKKTGLIKIAIEWYDPNQAKQWLDWMVIDLNNKIKDKDLADASKSIQYLQQSLKKTSVIGFKEVFYNLIENQTKTMMLAEVRDEYVLKTIDPAVVPQEKIGPRRSVMCITGTVVGGIFGVLFVIARNFFKSRRLSPQTDYDSQTYKKLAAQN